MKFEKARLSDVTAIIALYKSVFSWAWMKTGRKFDKKYVITRLVAAIRNDITLVSRDSNEIIAFGWARKNRDHFGNLFGEIVILIVAESQQNHGVGKSLLAVLETKLPKDIRLSVLIGNERKQLYRKMGYSDFLKVLRKNRVL